MNARLPRPITLHASGPGGDLERLWLIVLASSGYVIAGGCGQVVSAGFYAQGDTVTPTRVGIATFLASIPLRANILPKAPRRRSAPR